MDEHQPIPSRRAAQQTSAPAIGSNTSETSRQHNGDKEPSPSRREARPCDAVGLTTSKGWRDQCREHEANAIEMELGGADGGAATPRPAGSSGAMRLLTAALALARGQAATGIIPDPLPPYPFTLQPAGAGDMPGSDFGGFPRVRCCSTRDTLVVLFMIS